MDAPWFSHAMGKVIGTTAHSPTTPIVRLTDCS